MQAQNHKDRGAIELSRIFLQPEQQKETMRT